MDYHAKYIKYKTKYLELKNIQDGGNIELPKKKDILWITYVNKNYIDFVINFSLYAKPLKFNLIAFCLDDESFGALKNVFQCIRFIDKNKVNSYKNTLFLKLDVILHAMDLFKDHKLFGYIDSDIVLFENPNNYILKIVSKNKDVKIFTQCNESYSYTECTNRKNCPYLCSGVMVMRNSDDLKSAFKYTNADIDNFENEQKFLTYNLDKLKVKRYTFSRYAMPNGDFIELYKAINTYRPRPTLKEALLLHFNYLFSSDKITVMKKWNWWDQSAIDKIKKSE